MSDKFELCYEVDDGYVGPSRPHYVTVDDRDIDDDMDEYGLRHLYGEAITDDFFEQISPIGRNEKEFIAWAISVIEARK